MINSGGLILKIMDVGATVGNTAFITAIFAFLSCIALFVELGDKPKDDQAPNSGDSEKTIVDGDSVDHLDKTLDSTHAALTDGVARSQIKETASGASLTSLRARFIDGFLGPRIKYDVALTTLFESQNKKVDTPDEGSDMATQAFLEATQSIIFSED